MLITEEVITHIHAEPKEVDDAEIKMREIVEMSLGYYQDGKLSRAAVWVALPDGLALIHEWKRGEGYWSDTARLSNLTKPPRCSLGA